MKRPYEDTIERSRDRRQFLKTVSAGAMGLVLGTAAGSVESHASTASPGESSVSFVTGTDRRDMMHRVLEPLKGEIRLGIAGKQVVLKCNLVGPDALSAVHVDAVRGVLDFLKPMYSKVIIIGDSTGRTYPGPVSTWKHFEIHKYLPLPAEYKVKLVDFNDLGTRRLWVVDKGLHPSAINIIDIFLDPKNYIISLAQLKTHSNVVATLSVKNMAMGSPINHYRVGNSEKNLMHAGSFKNLNFNIFTIAQHVRPALSIIDGLVGMEGNGPTQGTAVEHGIALAGTDMIAVDRIGTQLMGIKFEDIGYLTYCAQADMGQSNPARIRIIGPDPAQYVKRYKLHQDFERQMIWKEGLVIDPK